LNFCGAEKGGAGFKLGQTCQDLEMPTFLSFMHWSRFPKSYYLVVKK